MATQLLPAGFAVLGGAPGGSEWLRYNRRAMKRKRATAIKNGVTIVARAKLPTRFGEFTIVGLRGAHPSEELAVLQRGKVNGPSIPLVRIH